MLSEWDIYLRVMSIACIDTIQNDTDTNQNKCVQEAACSLLGTEIEAPAKYVWKIRDHCGRFRLTIMSIPDEPKPWLVNCGDSPIHNSTWLLKWYLPQINGLRFINQGLTLTTYR